MAIARMLQPNGIAIMTRSPDRTLAPTSPGMQETEERTAAGPQPTPAVKESSGDGAAREHIRGSSILLFGRLISLGLNFGVQILTVRYLAKSDYGAFAYALSVVSMGASVALFGLDKAVARFIPIYEERQQYGKMFGTMLLSLGTIFAFGVAMVSIFIGAQGLLTGRFITDPLAVSLLVIMIALAPTQALDSWFQGLFAVFAKPQAIFFRRHVLGPGLKLLAVLAVILTQSNVFWLGAGYLIGGLLGVATYAVMLVQVLKSKGLWTKFSPRRLKWPAREVYGFSVPLLTTDAMNILKSNMVVILLEYFATTVQVAEFQAVWPVARLNLFVMQSFKYLFTPLAARLFAREDMEGVNDLYWKTATWIALFSFPLFAVSFSLARPLTVLIFEERYASSASILALLAFGNYFNAAFGFNSYTLRVYGKVAYIVVIDVATAILGLALNLLLIPRYGAMGAAIATTAMLVIYNILNHLGLLFGTKIDLFQWRYVRVYAGIAIASLGLFALQQMVDLSLPVGVVIAAVISIALVRINRDIMNVGEMFPEVNRIPVVNKLIA
jgi:O-antigen/teichoic acid export membrane protein